MKARWDQFYDRLLGRWGRRMLAGKLATVVLVATAIIIPSIFATIWLSSRSVFLELETRNVSLQVARAQNAMRVFETQLSKSVGDYANWDDSYAYMRKPDAAFEESTLNPFTFKSMGIDFAAYVRFDGNTAFTRAVDLKTEAILPGESEILGTQVASGAFFSAAKAGETHRAYVRTKRGLYLLYSEWQSDSLGKARPEGFVVMGNLIAPQMLSDALQADARLNLDLDAPLARGIKASQTSTIFVRKDTQTLSGIAVRSQDGGLLGVVEFDTPRSLILAGRGALFSMAAALIGGILLLVACLWVGVRMVVVRRLHSLQNYVEHYGDNPEMPANIAAGEDELARLAQAFKALSDDLHQAEQKLTQKSYLQGKADSAAGMLHNVRNALAPVRVMQDKWLREEALPFRQNMAKAAEELARDDITPDRKAALEAFMVTAARQIALGAEARLDEMQEIKSSIDQISAILAGYNFNTSGATGGDEFDFLGLLRAEIKILDGREGDNVVFDLPEAMPRLLGNPLHLTQVLGNILVNADEAMIASGVTEKRIRVTHQLLEDDRIEIRLTDNGDGISEGNIPKAFKREYSTRTHKSGGIGLHWSANAMRAMRGSIALESEGEGNGATAVLTLPVAKAKAQTDGLKQAA